MRTLLQCINESIRHLSSNETGIAVFDIDDTLLKSDPSLMKIWKKKPGEKEIPLSTDEYAKDPDAATHKDWFSYREFRDKEKVYKSIIKGTPQIKNLKILDAYINAGYDFCFLTARGCEETIKDAIQQFVRVRDKNGVLRELGSEFKENFSHAVNDDNIIYPGTNDPEKKAIILRELATKYSKVVFVDDDKKNVKYAQDLDIPNLTVIKAW